MMKKQKPEHQRAAVVVVSSSEDRVRSDSNDLHTGTVLESRHQTRKVVPRALAGMRYAPRNLRASDFFDYLTDMYAFPDEITLRAVRNGKAGLNQDAQNIRKYFEKAQARMAQE